MEASGRFPRRQRLSLKRDYDAVFARGISEADRSLVVYMLPTELGHPRLGMAVGKKHGGAVERNRIKRLIREAFRLNRDRLPGSADIVVIPRRGAILELAEITASLVELSQRAAEKTQ
jgi:ribonuclease P protein component